MPWVDIDMWLRDLENRQTEGLPRRVLIQWETQLNSSKWMCVKHGTGYRPSHEG